ncbi:hypothetical protein NDU88_000625 [Pleurodeles waltl]|uniref:Uncharacterized protein n=1 Tax=Pleurodeles waltl TaxID=8319 RepID=A0AAV7NAZ4_PLEWA|nr:hypothetical protein NDU88_000625 [Pleurodeles waltl]
MDPRPSVVCRGSLGVSENTKGVQDTCNRAVTATATIQTPQTSEGCPGVTRQVVDNPEVIPNLDIWVYAASAQEEKGLRRREEARHWTEPEERRVEELHERRFEEPEERKFAESEERSFEEPDEIRFKEPEERRVEEPEERRDLVEKQSSKDRNTETPAATDGRHDRTRHVPGGAWLSQVRLCLRVHFLPLWTRGGSERDLQGRDREEGVLE